MSTIRINAALRDHVVAGLIRHRFNAEEVLLQEQRDAANKLTDAAHKLGYETVYTEAERKILEGHPDWFYKQSYCNVAVEQADGSTEVTRIQFGDSKPVPHNHYMDRVTKIISKDAAYFTAKQNGELAQREVDSAQRDLNERKNAMMRRAISVINSVTTVKRLLEIWPEVHDFLPEENAGSGGSVPALLVEDLNRDFNLGKTE